MIIMKDAPFTKTQNGGIIIDTRGNLEIGGEGRFDIRDGRPGDG